MDAKMCTFLGIWGGIPKAGDKIQGHARAESLQDKWLNKGYHAVEIPGIELFSERNTVQKNGEMVRFSVPDGHVIKAVAKVQDLGQNKKIFDVRVITEPAAGPLKGIHHRMPMIREAAHPEEKE
jgi:hypothetical protein